MSGALAVGLLVGSGVYLVLQRGLVRMMVGFILLSHGINVLLVRAGGLARGVPIAPFERTPADPTGQAFALTAIVVTFGTTIYLVAVALRRATAGEDDDPEDDPETDPDEDAAAAADQPGEDAR